MNDEVIHYMIEVTTKFSFEAEAGFEPYQTEAVAFHFNIDRTRASRILNELVKEDILLKVNTRPVCFLHRETIEKNYGNVENSIYDSFEALKIELVIDKAEGIFSQMIGYEKSLKEAIQQIKTSIYYPDNGLPLMLLGPTGVGKTFLAKLIYDYTQAKRIIAEDAPFFVFNCALYANNPELLTSYLFGHSKGSFTGAIKDQMGLIEQANQGILFLDEVHRLDREGQEKLFTFMDQGTFSRMGETNVVRKSKVRLIFATTENLSIFLETFLRRIPITVNVPSLEERGEVEKSQFIQHFFTEECKLLGIPIHVTNKVLDVLNKFIYTGNIGDCKNIIKYACGCAYSKRTKNMDEIFVTLQELPGQIYKNSPQFFGHYTSKEGGVLFHPHKKRQILHVNETKVNHIEQTYRNCLGYFVKLENSEWKELVFLEKCTEKITALMDNLIFERPNESKSIMMEFNFSAIQDIFRYLETHYNIKYDGNSVYALSSYLFFKSHPFTLNRQEETLTKQMLQFIKRQYKAEYLLVAKIMSFIEQSMELNLYQEDTILMTLFLCKKQIQQQDHRVKAMIIAHGYATASSIANVCNRLLGVKVYDFIDMPVESSIKDITKQMLQYMEENDTLNGLVVLVDMGSLSQIHDQIKEVIDGPLICIDQVSTSYALEIGNYISQGRSIEEIVKPLELFVRPNINLYYPIKRKEYAIVTSCFTGIGTATQIQQLLSESMEDMLDIKVVPHDFERLKKNGINEPPFRIYDVLAIVGTANPGMEGINYISLEDIISGKGENDVFKIFEKMAPPEIIRKVNDRIIKNFSLRRVIDSLTILDTEKVISKVEEGIKLLENQMRQKLPNDKKIVLFVHVSCMIERLIRKSPILEYPNQEKFERDHKKEISIIRNAFSVLEKNYSVQMNIPEIGYMYNIIKPNLFSEKD